MADPAPFVVRLLVTLLRTAEGLAEASAAGMDNWTHRTRENLGMEPDWDVERRIAKRRSAQASGREA